MYKRQVETNGFMRLDKGKPIINLAWNAQEFTVISRADRLLVLSGKGATELTDNLLSISGNFTVNRGLAAVSYTHLDAGNVANLWQDLKPVYGYGLGVRWKSPLGPIGADIAYGQEVDDYRLHFNIGVAF